MRIEAKPRVVGDSAGACAMYRTRPSSPTRGFASILTQGIDGLTPEEVLAIPEDFPTSLGLGGVVSLLRLRGMSGMLTRAKRQVREQLAATARHAGE